MKTNNHCVVDLNKCQWAEFYYRNQWNDVLRLKPKEPTMQGAEVKDEMHFNGKQTMLEFATEKNLVDVWIPECKVTVTANKTLVYIGKKAESIWREWNRRIFKREKK